MSKTHEHLDERQFLIAVRRLADTLATGSDVSPHVGAGVDYAQARLYAAGDSTRAIDWRVTARTGKTFVKEYDAPKRLAAHIVVDASASMRISAGDRTKFDWAVLLAGALALSTLNRQNPAGLYATTDGDAALHVRPTLLRDRVHQWLTHARTFAASPRLTATLATTLGRVDVAAAERGVIVVLADLHEPDAVASLKRLAQRHDVLVLRLLDAAERHPIGGGIFRAVEAETGRRFLGVSRRVAAAFADTRAQLAGAQVDTIELCIADAFLPRLQLFLRERARARGR